MLDLRYLRIILERPILALVTLLNLLTLLQVSLIPITEEKFLLFFFNLSDKFYQINVGDNIAQIIFQKISTSNLEEFSIFDGETERGCGGFGSTNFSSKVLSSDLSTQKF